MASFDVDPLKHKKARTQEKIRAKVIRGSKGEQSVAKSKLRRPEELPPRFAKLSIPKAPNQAKADKKSWSDYFEGSWKNEDVKEDNGNLESWVQSKITKAADYIDTAADYVTNEETDGIKAKNYKGRLDRWFDDGGWVQTGGKYDGKPCAQQPGQTTKPYCRDPDDRASMDTEERNKRAAKKRRQDPNPNRSGKAKMVTQESAGEKDACYKKVKSRYKVWPSAYASGALVKCRKVGAANWGTKTEETMLDEEMITAQKAKEKRLKAKYDKSDMKQNMIDRYGKKKGTEIYFATIRKQAMADSFDFDGAYEYIIELLVAEDYAENYEAAEVMFKHISDEFTATILEEYIEEKARGTRKKTTVHAYDVDETLFGHGKKGKPNVQVHVNDASGKRVKSLSNQEFNTHKLDKGHSYDFSEFQSAKKFKETSSPNKKVIKDIKRKQARGQNVHLITARSKFDNPSEFQGHLKKHGVDVDKTKIHYTGGMKGGDIGKKKVNVANAVAKQSGAKKIHMYDDAAKVHKAFEKEKGEAPATKKIKTHMIAPDKKGEARVRSYQATKIEEMTAYEYWKQFID